MIERAARATRWVWARRRRFVLASAGAAAVLATSVALRGLHFIYLDRSGLPDLEPFLRFKPPTIGGVYDANGEVLLQVAREYRKILTYGELPAVLRNAILTAEDKRFFGHSGVDYRVLPRVALRAVSFSRPTAKKGLVFWQGGSTITQQLVRTYFLRHLTGRENGRELLGGGFLARVLASAIGHSATNKLMRKAEEVRVSLWLEEEMLRRFGSRQAAKEQILARYASFVYLGHGRYGYSAASDYYFGKALSSYRTKDADKAALLAGITKSPQVYGPRPGHISAGLKRRNDILERMVRNDYLPAALAERCRKAPVVLADGTPVRPEAPGAIGTVFAELGSLDDERISVEALVDGKIRVGSSVDLRIQRIVNDALEKGLDAYEARHRRSKGLLQGSVVVLGNGDAAILAEAGGRRFYGSKESSYSDFNRAADSMHQPGSAMKPIVYLAALRRGTITLDSPIPDVPISVAMGENQPEKWIANYDGEFKGVIPARQALAESRNAAAVWLARAVGMRSIARTARELGITTPLAPNLSTALGASEVRLVELANVYRALASGVWAAPHAVVQVLDDDGEPIPLDRPAAHALDFRRADLLAIQEGLRGVVRLVDGTAHSLDSGAFPIPVMGKTGTTNDFRDALFVGSTYGAGGITVAVRIGFDDNRELGDRETGARVALPVFKEVMLGVYRQKLAGPVPRFPGEIEDGISRYSAAITLALLEGDGPPALAVDDTR